MRDLKEDILFGSLTVGDTKKPTTFELDFSALNDIKKIIVREECTVEIFGINLNDNNIKIEVKKDASLTFKSIFKTQLKNVQIDGILMKNSTISLYFADFSKGESNAKMSFNLVGDNSSCFYRLASISENTDKKVFDISIDHTGISTYGLVDNYGVCKDKSKLSFLGTSYVKKGAIKTKTRQSANILVFDDISNGLCKPILKIDENDIEASHGASLGKPNEEQMFYLMSRGLTENEAKQLIITGYLNPILSVFKNDYVKEEIFLLLGDK